MTSVGEAADATLRSAPAGPRLLAYFVDWLVTVIIGSVLVSAGGMQLYLATDQGRREASDTAVYAFLLISALVIPLWLVTTFLGWSLWGRTVGKLALGLRIVNRRGRRPGVGRGVARLLVYTVENLPLLLAPMIVAIWIPLRDRLPDWTLPALALAVAFGVAALLPALLARDGRALHDRIAGTMVIEE